MDQGPEDYDLLFKVVLTGDSGVGKSSIISQFVRKEFKADTRTTIGVEFSTYYTVIDGKKIATQIWDTAGQERYRAVTSLYYRKALGVLLVYDITSHQSFRNLSNWLREATTHCDPDSVVMMVGNKTDKRHLRTVPVSEAQEFAEKQNFRFVETSALDSSNIESAFQSIIEDMYNRKILKGQERQAGQQVVLPRRPSKSGKKFDNLKCCAVK